MRLPWLVAVVAVPALAQPAYEDRLIHAALARAGTTLEPAPEGKPVERVVVAAEDVFGPGDPYPTFLNVFHVRTRDAVVRREVLLAEGQPYLAVRAQETERNLRRLFFLAVARVVAGRGDHGGVVVVVATKDKWSLRLSNAFTLLGPLLQYLLLQLTEANFNGWGQSLSVGMTLRLDTVSISQTFAERRLFGTRVGVFETASIVLGRASGAVEGTSGQLTVGQRLLTLDQDWGYLLDGTWNVRRRRVFRGASVWQLPYPEEGAAQTVPLEYDVREGTAELSGTRSLGRSLKLDVTVASGFWLRQYAPPVEGLSQAQRDWLVARYLPRSETVVYGQLFARAFPADFRVLRNIETIELSEDYQLGWLVQGGVRVGVPVAGQGVFVEVGAAARYRVLASDDLFTVTVAGGARFRWAQATANQRLVAELVNYSPPLHGGRLVTRLLVDFKWNDLDNRQLLLGGSTGLRGAFAEQLVGRNLVLANVEYRARPVELVPASWLGIVVFYDVGSAFDVTPAPVHTVGLGLRILLPQLNYDVLRVDLGIVLGGPVPGLDRLNASWGQVTELRPDFLDQPL